MMEQSEPAYDNYPRISDYGYSINSAGNLVVNERLCVTDYYQVNITGKNQIRGHFVDPEYAGLSTDVVELDYYENKTKRDSYRQGFITSLDVPLTQSGHTGGNTSTYWARWNICIDYIDYSACWNATTKEIYWAGRLHPYYGLHTIDEYQGE